MFLLVNPNGSKYWRFKYRYGGKEKLLALGVYPDLSLADDDGDQRESGFSGSKGTNVSRQHGCPL
jgi:Arm DNA-binding domain